MKTNNLLLRSLMALVALLGCMSASAYDFSAVNEQGQTIYYNITDATALTVEVTKNTIYSNGTGTYKDDMVIPSTVEFEGTTYTVTRIGYEAFYRGDYVGDIGTVTSVALPNTITSIGDNAFINQKNLLSISIPNGVTMIGKRAFSFCGLESIALPSGLTYIGESAFNNCNNMTMVISAMNNPVSIESGTFPKRRSQTLYIPTGCLLNYVTADYWKEFNEILEPSKINFEDSNVEDICVQNWDTDGNGYLDQIEAYMVTDFGTAFQGNNHITKFNELQYFTGLTSISDNAFANCTNLTAITLPEQVKAIGSSAFSGCSSLATVANLNNLTAISENAFANCTSLTELSINAATIENGAFQGCTGLIKVNVTATTIKDDAFRGCTGLRTLTVNATTVNGDAFHECSALTTVSFNANSVESNTFRDCTNLTSVTLGSRVADIKEGAFKNCTGLIAINIPGSVITLSGGFEGCTSLSNVTLNSGTKYIVNSVFLGCSSLTSITLPNSLLYIGESVFEGTGLTEINIPSSVTSIQSRAFYDCDYLTKVMVNWTTPLVVPADAFPNRANQLLIVPRDTKESYQSANVWKDFKWIYDPGCIESYAVLSDDGMTLTFYHDAEKEMRTEATYILNEGANKPGWNTDNSYRNVSTVVFDPSFAAARPTSTSWWFGWMGKLTSIVGIEHLNTSEVTNMSNMFSTCWSMEEFDLSHFDTGNVADMSFMFSYCEGLTSLDLSSFNTSNVYTMEGMFYECSGLSSLDLGGFDTEHVSNFNEMFFDCAGLSSLDLRSFDTQGAQTMEGMFLDCSGLTSLDLSSFNTEHVDNMNSMFGGCTNLTTLDLTSFNTSYLLVTDWMFYNCRNLRTIYVGDDWDTGSLDSSEGMFMNCVSLVGSMGTTYDANHVDDEYAHIDGGPSNPGYFTDNNASLRGDVNGDGSVNISDVTALIDYLLTGNASEISMSGVDTNQDGSINISDVTALIDHLLTVAW